MKPEEAIEILGEVKELDDSIYAYSPAYMDAINIAIEALKEIQQYREIGTIEELKYFKDMKVRLEKYHANISVSRLLECFIETVFENTKHEGFIILTNQEAKDYEAYCSIGTVEQCRKAVDKQKLKKPVKDKYNHNCCPNCGWIVSGEGGYGEEFCPHCENCGQAIRWENLGKWKMSEIKLKPCPFCWSENVRLMSNETEDGSPCCINSDDELEAKYSYVHCYGCDMDFCPDSDIAKDVMEAWNRRAGGQNE